MKGNNDARMTVIISTAARESHPPDAAAKGKRVYLTYCAICHGANMRNAATRSFDLRKFPVDQRARFEKSVKTGKKDMPAWGDVLDAEQLDTLWAYIGTRGK